MSEPDRKTLSADQARDLFEYSIVSGRLYWRVSRGPIKAGDRAGTPSDDGSYQVGVNYARYKAHRLAVLIVTGTWPTHDVDHRDGSPSNNAWLNLRDVTHVVNQQNRRRAHSNNKSKLLGTAITRAHYDDLREADRDAREAYSEGRWQAAADARGEPPGTY